MRGFQAELRLLDRFIDGAECFLTMSAEVVFASFRSCLASRRECSAVNLRMMFTRLARCG